MHGKSMGILAAALMLALAPFTQAEQPPAYFIDEEKGSACKSCAFMSCFL